MNMTSLPLLSPELVLPAGDAQKAKFAIAFGADAIYLGMPKFSLRARENGFQNIEDLIQTIHWVHQQKKKAYLTANIFAHNHKVNSFIDEIKPLLAQVQPDAWVMSDPGLIMLMRQHYPEQVIHLSVQSNVMNAASASFWHQQGIQRIILSREITMAEIKSIHQTCPEVELECFVHGSICMAYSGRCLISNYLAHRDSNQGLCTHSCRWQYQVLHQPAEETPYQKPYQPLQGNFFLEEAQRKNEYLPIDEDENGTYIMNAKDLCAVPLLDDLIQSGISAFKVEGRSKTLYYVSMIARAYRQAIDQVSQRQPLTPSIFEDIHSTSSRGFTQGFLTGDLQEKSIDYHQSASSYQQYRFTGIVQDYQNGHLWIEVRNPIQVGKTYQLCTPEKTFSFEVSSLLDEKGKAISIIHGGLHSCRVPFSFDPGKFALIREFMPRDSDSQ